MKRLTTTFLTLALSGFCLGTAFAQEKKAAAGADDLSKADKEFLEAAAQTDMLEIEAGKLAGDKGSSTEVKKFGSKLVKDHTASSADLKSLAASKGVELPAELDAKHRGKADGLAKLEGEKFDKEFLELNAAGHKKAIALYEKAAKSKDGEIAAFAQKTLPTLKEHHAMATGADHGDSHSKKEKDAVGKKADKRESSKAGGTGVSNKPDVSKMEKDQAGKKPDKGVGAPE